MFDMAGPMHEAVAPSAVADRFGRLVAWNCDVLSKIMKEIIARRDGLQIQPDHPADIKRLETDMKLSRYVLGEVHEVVRLPHYEQADRRFNADSVQLGQSVEMQLHRFVQTLAAMYQDNPVSSVKHVGTCVRFVWH